MYLVERNSQDKLGGIFPKKEMSLFLVSHSTEITLVWAQRGVKSGNLYFNPWDSVLPNYGTQEKKGSSIYQSKSPCLPRVPGSISLKPVLVPLNPASHFPHMSSRPHHYCLCT